MIKKTIIGLLALVLLLVPAACNKSSEAPVTEPELAPPLAPLTPAIDIPEGPPVITANASYIMRGEFNLLSIYEDGSVMYAEEKGLRDWTEAAHPVRIWKTGQLRGEELSSLLEFFKNSRFEELSEYYQFPGEEIEGGGSKMGDMDYAVSINYGDLHKTARAFGYLTPDGGMTYPDMPYPLNEIYQKLKNIAENQTEEVYRESIQSSLLWE